MNRYTSLAAIAIVACAPAALAQGGNPDYRLKADLRTPDNGQWGGNESVGNVDFRIQSRFLQVYYGGVARQDEFKFKVNVQFTDISGFASQFAGSAYNTNYDVYINNTYVGRAIMGLETAGIASLTYDSRHPTPPELPLPAGWPSPIAVDSTLRIFFAAGAAPAIGSALPAGTPVFESLLEEQFDRGDANQDGKVDLADFAIFASNNDPASLTGLHVGPMRGDFTGDNVANSADYAVLATNWTANSTIPPEPAPCMTGLTQPASVTSCRNAPATFSTLATGSGTMTYQWRRNGLAISPLSNPSAATPNLTIARATSATAGSYTCAISNGCLSVTTNAAVLSLLPACNPADVTFVGGGEGDNCPDMQITVDDLVAFVNAFSDAADCPRSGPCNLADVAAIGGSATSPGTPDGQLTVDDLIVFVNAFSDGCAGA